MRLFGDVRSRNLSTLRWAGHRAENSISKDDFDLKFCASTTIKFRILLLQNPKISNPNKQGIGEKSPTFVKNNFTP